MTSATCWSRCEAEQKFSHSRLGGFVRWIGLWLRSWSALSFDSEPPCSISPIPRSFRSNCFIILMGHHLRVAARRLAWRYDQPAEFDRGIFRAVCVGGYRTYAGRSIGVDFRCFNKIHSISPSWLLSRCAAAWSAFFRFRSEWVW